MSSTYFDSIDNSYDHLYLADNFNLSDVKQYPDNIKDKIVSVSPDSIKYIPSFHDFLKLNLLYKDKLTTYKELLTEFFAKKLINDKQDKYYSFQLFINQKINGSSCNNKILFCSSKCRDFSSSATFLESCIEYNVLYDLDVRFNRRLSNYRDHKLRHKYINDMYDLFKNEFNL